MRFDPLPLAMLPAKALRGLHRYAFPQFGERLYHPTRRLQAAPRGAPSIVLRVDDYPRWDIDTTHFQRFHEILQRRGASYVLGVTPFLNFHGREPYEFSNFEIDLLRRMAGEGATLGLHGFTHEEFLAPDGQPCETCFYSDETLRNQIGRAFKWFAQRDLPPPTHYIPPFNTFSARDFELLSASLPVIHGGPLSLSTLGKYAYSEGEGFVYAPSFEPFYGRAAGILEALRRGEAKLTRAMPYVLTLHWAWERATDFRHVGPLLDFLDERGWLAAPAVLGAAATSQ